MTTQTVSHIERNELKERLAKKAPDNQDKKKGYALVNVLSPEQFRQERIPGSINIPKDRLAEFSSRFDKDKEIIVYCASPSCDASSRVAKALADQGFTNVTEYDKGMSDWKAGNHPYESENPKA